MNMDHNTRRVHNFCRNGNIRRLKNLLASMTEEEAKNCLLSTSHNYFDGGRTVVHEATEAGLPNLIRYLVTDWGIDVNKQTYSMGSTALHMAASHGHVACVRVLLELGADMSITDTWQKTAKQTAALSSRKTIVKILTSEEVIKEVENNGDKLIEILRTHRDEPLEAGCLEKALLIATKNGNHLNVGRLIIRGATNLEEGLKLAIDLKKHSVTAILLLIQTARNSDKDLLYNIFNGLSTKPLLPSIGEADSKEIRDLVISQKVSTVVAIELARRLKNREIREELLLKTDVYEDQGAVRWHGLRLTCLEKSWFEKIQWVRELILARNGLTEIPEEIEPYFRQVRKLNLKFNQLTTVPKFLPLLPNLTHLNLACNKFTEIPHEWTPTLTVLDIADNQLSTLPDTLVAPSITKLYIDRNQFTTVPLCICALTTLQHLDISGNKEIEVLPLELSLLSNLEKLAMKGLPKLIDPPCEMLINTKHCMRYLNSRRLSSRRLFTMKLMIVGDQGTGKTKLATRLECVDPYAHVCGNPDITEWIYSTGFAKRKYRFSVWEISGLNNYINTCQVFLKLVERSMYLLLWNVKRGENGVAELKPWLDNISLRAPQSCVLIVGTHLDEVESYKRQSIIDDLMKKVRELADQYKALNVADIVTVGLEKPLENIGSLRESIYNNASLQKRNGIEVMGLKIPAAYYQLNFAMVRAQEDSCYQRQLGNHVLNAQQFKTMVQELALRDVSSDGEIETAVLFLNSIGTIFHCDHKDLEGTYFISPRCLSNIITKMISREQNQWASQNGILLCRDIPKLFNDDDLFPWQHFDQFVILLGYLHVAMPLDNQQLLIPSLLPSDPPPAADLLAKPVSYYCNRIKFQLPCPLGMWSRLVGKVLHAIPEICTMVTQEDNTTAVSLEQDGSLELPLPAGNVTACFPKQLELPSSMQQLQSFTANSSNEVQLVYWANGVIYKSSKIYFSITDQSSPSNVDEQQIEIMSYPTPEGVETLQELTKLVATVVRDNYPGYRKVKTCYSPEGQMDKLPMERTMHLVCNECLELGKPAEVNVTYNVLVLKKTMKTCARNHVLSVADFIPKNDKENK